MPVAFPCRYTACGEADDEDAALCDPDIDGAILTTTTHALDFDTVEKLDKKGCLRRRVNRNPRYRWTADGDLEDKTGFFFTDEFGNFDLSPLTQIDCLCFGFDPAETCWTPESGMSVNCEADGNTVSYDFTGYPIFA